MGTGWIVRRDERETPPLTTDQLKDYAGTGKLRRNDEVRREDQPDWHQAGTVKGLFPQAPSLDLSAESGDGPAVAVAPPRVAANSVFSEQHPTKAERPIAVTASRLGEAFTGRLSALFFPSAMTVSSETILKSRRRCLLFIPVGMHEDKMPVKKLASYSHIKGIIWDGISIETTGGEHAIEVHGLSKASAQILAARLDKMIKDH